MGSGYRALSAGYGVLGVMGTGYWALLAVLGVLGVLGTRYQASPVGYGVLRLVVLGTGHHQLCLEHWG